MQSYHDTYLCQVSETVSCGACCGLYNVADPRRHRISGMLERRSCEFSGVPRETGAIVNFGRKEYEKVSREGLPMPEFYHCPYIGLIGPHRTRAGCLLHPMGEGNNGIDYRGLSYYGSMTCRVYFCPTHRRLPRDLKRIMRRVVDDWYLFGLLVQETRLLKSFSDEIAARCGENFEGSADVFDPGARALWNRLFELKVNWPFADPSLPLANYFFNDDLYPRPQVDYSRTGKTGSGYDAIFRELGSVFESEAELLRAEEIINEIFENLCAGLDSK